MRKILEATLFSNIDEDEPIIRCVYGVYRHCIPYNEETKYLIGTSNDCPDYYKWWEE